MQKHYHAPPNVEVAGSAAKSMVDNLGTSDIAALVEHHGLQNITLGSWVALSRLCDLFNDITTKQGGGASSAFVAMGIKIAEQSEFPPDILAQLSVPVMIMGWNEHYRVNHRGGDLAPITPEQISETEYVLHMVGEAHPYPYDMTYGMVYGFCRTLLPSGTRFRVSYDDHHSPFDNWQDGVILRVHW